MAGLSATPKGRLKLMLMLTGAVALGGVIALVLVLCGVRVFCPFHLLTGLNCPGCGNTRAVMALFHLDVQAMLRYNLLFPLEIYYIARIYGMCVVRYVRFARFEYRPRSYVFDVIVLVLLVIWTVVRNCTSL